MINRPDTRSQRLKRHKRVRCENLRHARASPPERVPQRDQHLCPDHRRCVPARPWSPLLPLEKDFSCEGTKTDAAKQVGVIVAERAKAKGIETVVFDRGGYVYHGRVKALAEGAREGGLQF